HLRLLSSFPTRRSSDLSPRFVVDKVGRYRLSVVATDARGIRSAPATIDLDTTTCGVNEVTTQLLAGGAAFATTAQSPQSVASFRSEEHTSELQSLAYLV